MLADSATAPLPPVAAFDGGQLRSDGGLPWLTEADAALGLSAAAYRLLDTLRLRLLKVAGRVYQLATRIRLRLPIRHAGWPLGALLAARPSRREESVLSLAVARDLHAG